MSRIKIIGVHIEQDASGIEHISELHWTDPDLTGQEEISVIIEREGICSRSGLVAWLLIAGNSAFAEDPRNGKVAEVRPHPQSAPYYVRTDSDDEKQDNLLYQDRNWSSVPPSAYRLP